MIKKPARGHERATANGGHGNGRPTYQHYLAQALALALSLG